MSQASARQLKIRAMVYTAGEPTPFFWPMRSFIHHNPLHGLEHLTFADAVRAGERLFQARGFLSRPEYQAYLAQGQVCAATLTAQAQAFAASREAIPGIRLADWLMALLTQTATPVIVNTILARPAQVHAALCGNAILTEPAAATEQAGAYLRAQLLGATPIQEAIDALYGTDISAAVDEHVIHGCAAFFDEGQAAWSMPDREQGLFQAWRNVAGRAVRRMLDGVETDCLAQGAPFGPEDVIDRIMRNFGIEERRWSDYFTREIARLQGWSGFIRWRATAKHYHWTYVHPGDLVDLLAIRLTLAQTLIDRRAQRGMATHRDALAVMIASRLPETWLRYQFHTGAVAPDLAHMVDDALARGRDADIQTLFIRATAMACRRDAQRQADNLRALAQQTGEPHAFEALPPAALRRAMQTFADFERQEGMIWLQAMERHATNQLLDGITLPAAPRPDNAPPFAQALFCIDTRSERIRRHLESVGDYQTFGIAGFFGVPVSFIAASRGSETHLCPVMLTPKNLVLEMPAEIHRDPDAITVLEKALDALKTSVLSPFVAVEAIGLLFGIDMAGKTLAPRHYHRWRDRPSAHPPGAHLMLDKLSRAQADAIVHAVQRTVIRKALMHELAWPTEHITDDLIGALRSTALGRDPAPAALLNALGLTAEHAHAFIDRLRTAYRINPAFEHLQIEHLARIGFSLDEQARFVATALNAIGLTRGFSRLILLVAHGGQSENNPYESALDCGACGGNHGLINARVLANMANKPQVRDRLRAMGLTIHDDTGFLPALHNTTTDDIQLFDLDRLPPSHLVYLDRLRDGLGRATRRCARERLPELHPESPPPDPATAVRDARRNAVDWSQVRPEWGLARNAYFIIGRRELTQTQALAGRAFLHSYDYRTDTKRRLLESILTGPLVVGQWINMEHYFSTVDNERFGSGSKVYHNVVGRFGVMTGNLSDLRIGLPAQTVLNHGKPFHQPLRLITVIEAPFDQALAAIEGVVTVKRLVRQGWIRLIVIDPETHACHIHEHDRWRHRPGAAGNTATEEPRA